MYTATKLGESINQQKQRLVVTVQFDDGAGHVFDKDFEFGLTTPLETKKRAVKAYLDEINFVIVPIDDFIPTTDPTPTGPTQAELDRADWEANVEKLKKIQELIDCGVTFTAPQLTAIANLRTSVANNFNQNYL
jgi:hypothetical protein